MAKRKRTGDDASASTPFKRCRTGARTSLLDLSDELIVRILSCLPTADLLRSECVSRQLRALATDHEVWKRKYLETFGLRHHRNTPFITSRGGVIDWKSRFRTKTNWRNGRAKLHQQEVASPPSPPVVAKVHHGIIFTVDRLGLRAWQRRHGERELLAHIALHTTSKASCIAVDTGQSHWIVLIGFDDGSCSMYEYDNDHFEHQLSHVSDDGPLIAISTAFPYAITVSRTRFLTLYRLTSLPVPTMDTLARLQSDATVSPVSVTVRRNSGHVIAAIAYAFERLQTGWCLGVQEMRLGEEGEFLSSRLVSTIDTPLERTPSLAMRFTSSTPLPLHPLVMSPPTSLSYEHPFLICALADNTIMSFLVVSTDDILEISAGRRLWGHTSAVSGAEVNNRGKAISISSRGDELRVWNLEAAMATRCQGQTSTQVQAVDHVTAAIARRGSGLGLAFLEMKESQELEEHTMKWVGFDDEQVVVLGVTKDQRQIMALYDFT